MTRQELIEELETAYHWDLVNDGDVEEFYAVLELLTDNELQQLLDGDLEDEEAYNLYESRKN